ncbi:MAG: hypothetical protein JO111_14990 [Caulobacteraceae bacterium]|nr:hypothetical protein [Caulobacteraceae bacterium]
MTRFRMMLAAGALSVAAASAAAAQQAPPTQATPDQPSPMGAPPQSEPSAPTQDMNAPPPPPDATAPSATASGANTSAQVVSPGEAPPSQVQALASGDNAVVTNGPVPDTPANRARYGGPMSMTGKHTKPAGN